MIEIYKVILQGGVLGGVLAWALWQNQKLVSKVISVVEKNSEVLTGLTAIIHEVKAEVRR